MLHDHTIAHDRMFFHSMAAEVRKAASEFKSKPPQGLIDQCVQGFSDVFLRAMEVHGLKEAIPIQWIGDAFRLAKLSGSPRFGTLKAVSRPWTPVTGLPGWPDYTKSDFVIRMVAGSIIAQDIVGWVQTHNGSWPPLDPDSLGPRHAGCLRPAITGWLMRDHTPLLMPILKPGFLLAHTQISQQSWRTGQSGSWVHLEIMRDPTNRLVQ